MTSRRTSLKRNLIIRIQIEISYQNPEMKVSEIGKETSSHRYKTIDELQTIYKNLMKERKT